VFYLIQNETVGRFAPVVALRSLPKTGLLLAVPPSSQVRGDDRKNGLGVDIQHICDSDFRPGCVPT
jgi:hypothetical protein